MKEVSRKLFEFLTAQSAFTDVIGEIDGVRKLYPIIADSDTPLPFSTYRLREQDGETKDCSAYIITLAAYFNDYDQALDFSDAMTPLIKKKYEWFNSEPEYDEVTSFYISFINFKINN
ncbi:MAG: hypothetical protein EOO51_12595 [Flavobacterium sp.]|nr:MAG: hypothetical protein EOO51_12595 [Flavobacterium sp.]